MKLHPQDEQLYAETLVRLTKAARSLEQKHAEYMKLKLDEYFEFRASLDDSEILGEDLRLRWRS